MTDPHGHEGHGSHDRSAKYQENSLSLTGAVSLGTGVMIGAGIFALTGQVAELAGEWFPFAFLAAAIIVGFSAYSYVKMSNAYPSAGGIAMFLEKAYGKTMMTGACIYMLSGSVRILRSRPSPSKSGAQSVSTRSGLFWLKSSKASSGLEASWIILTPNSRSTWRSIVRIGACFSAINTVIFERS